MESNPSSMPMPATTKSRLSLRRLKRQHWIAMGAAALVFGATGWWVGETYFFPESATRVDEAPPESAAVVKAGMFQGAGDGVHEVSGMVKILQMDGKHYLRFENYDQTQGPDVFVYLTRSPSPSSKDEVETGLRVLIDGGADGGESTKEGNFQQALPADFDPAMYAGVAVWCDQFNVLFGKASFV